MSAYVRYHYCGLVVFMNLCAGLLFPPSTHSHDPTRIYQKTVVGVEALGLVTFDTGFLFADTEVGGLSGITYDANRGVYYVLSDDRNLARYYTVAIDLAHSRLDPGDVSFQDVTILSNRHSAPFLESDVDPEGIALARADTLYIASEGETDAEPPLPPFAIAST